MTFLPILAVLGVVSSFVYLFIHTTRRAMRGFHDVPTGMSTKGLRAPSRIVSVGWTLVAAGFFLTLASTLVPVEITPENSRAAGFGYPFHFVTADTAFSVPEGETAQVGYDAWEFPADVHLGLFLASWAIVAAVLLIPLALFAAIRRRARARLLRPSAHPS